jgi:4-amino-4-deoxy-L-arabinose transferase-like glycosyltransferase
MAARLNARFCLACLWALFLIRGLFYIAVLPLWEGFDEWAHYAFVQSVATGSRLLIERSERVSREVEASLDFAPWRPSEPDHAAQQAAYWRLTDGERATREQALQSIPAQWALQPALRDLRSYEAQQAPLYYWLFSFLYKLVATFSFLARVWFLRMAGLLVASAVIPIGFLVARKVFRADLPALGVIAIVVSMPQLMMIVSRIANDCLAVPLGALLLYLLLRWKESPSSSGRSAALGVALGLSLLTKATFLAFIPPVLASLVLWAKPKRAYRQAALVILCAVGISAWWYVRNWMLTRSLSGEWVEIAAANAGPTFMQAVFRVNWIRAIDFGLLSQTWLGNWSFLVVRGWMYHFFYILVAGACVGLTVRFIRLRKQAAPLANLPLLTGVCLSFFAALGYHTVRSFQTEGFSGTFGYYAFPALIAEVILLSTGLEAITPTFAIPSVTPFITICFAALDFFGAHFFAIAYYTGFTVSQPNGGVHALSLSQLHTVGFQVMLARLTLNKPAYLSASVLATLWALFLAATLLLIALSVAIAHDRWTCPPASPWLPPPPGRRSRASCSDDR